MTITTAPLAARRRLVGILLVVMLAAAIVGVVVPAGLGWDFANFYDTGRRAAAGQLRDIYDTNSLIAGAPPQGMMAFWASPVSAWLYAPLSLFPPRVALLVFKLAGTLAFASGLWLLYREVRRCGGPNARLALHFCMAVILFQPFWTIYRVGGQTTPFVFLLLTLGLLAYLRQRNLACAFCLLGAVLVKPAFLVVPGVLALVSGRRFFLTLGAVFGGAGLLSLALFGWPIHRQFLEILFRGAEHAAPWMYNSSLYILADAFRPIVNASPVAGAGGALPALLALLLRLAVVLSAGVMFWRTLRAFWPAERRRLLLYLLAIVFCLLSLNVVWEHYLAVLFIPLAFLVGNAGALDRSLRLLVLGILVLAVFQNLILVLYVRDHFPPASTLALLGLSLVKAGPLLLSLAVLWFRRHEILRLAGAAR